MAPPEVWRTPLFRRINITITATWALSFTLSAAAQVVIAAYGFGAALSVLVQIAGFVLPLRFTAVYPDRARTRFLQQSGARLDAQGGMTS